MCITTVCFPGCDVINFEINLIFLIEPLFYMIKNSRQKFKYLEHKGEKVKKAFFIILRVLKIIGLEFKTAPLS